MSPALHPHLIIEPPSPKVGCRYHLSLQLPDAIFTDRDEIKDQWSSENVSWSLSPDKIDIERPIRNDTELVQLNLDLDPRVTSLDIPLHTRYLRPNAQGREEVIVFGQGAVQDGWACGGEFCFIPIERAPDSHCTGISPTMSPVPLPLEVSLCLPTGNTTHQPLVLLVTPVVIWLGWTYLIRKIKNLHRRIDATASKTKTL